MDVTEAGRHAVDRGAPKVPKDDGGLRPGGLTTPRILDVVPLVQMRGLPMNRYGRTLALVLRVPGALLLTAVIAKDEVDPLPQNLFHLFQVAQDVRTFANVAANRNGI